MRLCVPKSKVRFCICFGPVITKKCGTLLILLTVLLVIMTFLPLSRHRPKTEFIFNNKDMCASNISVVHSNHLSMMSGTENNEKTLVIVVLSERKKFMNRNLIRHTWGSVRSANNITILAVVFMLGNALGEEKADIRLGLETEMVQFGDIVMGDFIDTYRNLTLKTIMAYEWLSSFCREAQIVVKTDDDVVLNIFKLTEELDEWSQTKVISSNFWCAVHRNELVVMNATSKFYVSPDYFTHGVFPKHCAGVFYVTTMGVIRRILDEISNTFLGRVCTHEDVFMTGILPQKINSNGKNEPIELIDKYPDWFTFALDHEKGDDAQFLIKMLQQPVDEIENFREFRKRFGKTISYLLTRQHEFPNRFIRLWQIIENKL